MNFSSEPYFKSELQNWYNELKNNSGQHQYISDKMLGVGGEGKV